MPKYKFPDLRFKMNANLTNAIPDGIAVKMNLQLHFDSESHFERFWRQLVRAYDVIEPPIAGGNLNEQQ